MDRVTFREPQPTSEAAREVSGTEAIEVLRQFMGALETESLQDCARRAIEDYVRGPADRQNVAVVERAMVASMLQLDATDDSLMRWQHVFEAVEKVRRLQRGDVS
jgi:hypothetical protein